MNFPNDIADNPSEYLYLRRKRMFDIDGSGCVYGYGEQDRFTLCLSTDRLKTVQPLAGYIMTLPNIIEPSWSDYKNEYFHVKYLNEIDPLKTTLRKQIVMKRVSDGQTVENPISEFLEILKIFIAYGDEMLDENP